MRSAQQWIQVCIMMPDHVETVFWSMCHTAMPLVDSLYLVSLLLPLVAQNSALSEISVII